jgi:hypothetical protein
MPRHRATPIRRGPGCLWAKAGSRLRGKPMNYKRISDRDGDHIARPYAHHARGAKSTRGLSRNIGSGADSIGISIIAGIIYTYDHRQLTTA